MEVDGVVPLENDDVIDGVVSGAVVKAGLVDVEAAGLAKPIGRSGLDYPPGLPDYRKLA
jgi:hypothetical protein